jgi:hypothetical protein
MHPLAHQLRVFERQAFFSVSSVIFSSEVFQHRYTCLTLERHSFTLSIWGAFVPKTIGKDSN